jgi:hypothetical protein
VDGGERDTFFSLQATSLFLVSRPSTLGRMSFMRSNATLERKSANLYISEPPEARTAISVQKSKGGKNFGSFGVPLEGTNLYRSSFDGSFQYDQEQTKKERPNLEDLEGYGQYEGQEREKDDGYKLLSEFAFGPILKENIAPIKKKKKDKKKLKEKKKSKKTAEGNPVGDEELGYEIAELGFMVGEIDDNEVKIGKRIAWYVNGNSWIDKVYEGQWRGRDVLIKVPRVQELTPQQLLCFRRSVAHRITIAHPYVVSCLGACTVPGKFKIIEENLEEGGLAKLIRANMPKPIFQTGGTNAASASSSSTPTPGGLLTHHWTIFQRLKLASDIAAGMAWLHSACPPIIHRDLSTSNVAVEYREGRETAKVANFGFSMLLPDTYYPRKAAPETLGSSAVEDCFTKEGDVFSFSYILLELLTQEEPFGYHYNFDELIDLVCRQKERPEIPNECPMTLRQLIERCWQHDPRLRPTFSEISLSLDRIFITMAIRDEEGQRFWLENFPKLQTVEWSAFVKAFYRFLKVRPPRGRRYNNHKHRQQLQQQQQQSMPRVGLYTEHISSASSSSSASCAQDLDEIMMQCLKSLVVVREGESGEGNRPSRAMRKKKELVSIQQFGRVLEWFGPLSKDITLPPPEADLLPRQCLASRDRDRLKLSDRDKGSRPAPSGEEAGGPRPSDDPKKIDFVAFLPVELSMAVFRYFDEYDWTELESVCRGWAAIIRSLRRKQRIARLRSRPPAKARSSLNSPAMGVGSAIIVPPAKGSSIAKPSPSGSLIKTRSGNGSGSVVPPLVKANTSLALTRYQPSHQSQSSKESKTQKSASAKSGSEWASARSAYCIWDEDSEEDSLGAGHDEEEDHDDDDDDAAVDDDWEASGKRTILNTIYEVLTQKWFHGELETAEATYRIQNCPAGTFLVRFSTNSTHPGAFTITRVAGTSIGHIRITRSDDGKGKFIVNKDLVFDSLIDTIENTKSLLNLVTPCPGSTFYKKFGSSSTSAK